MKGVERMKDKYDLNLEQNIFLAKKLLVKNIYHTARLEGCNVTFPETETILNGVNVGTVTLDDITTILNLRDAWRYVIKNIKNKLDIDYICKVNEHVSRNESLDWGVLRYGEVGISGTEYKPEEKVTREDVEKKLNKILHSDKSTTEKAIKLFLWGCRTQLFWDGNKRTSLIVANKLLISEGKGILVISEKNLNEFNKKLKEFYDTNDYSRIDKFLYDNCIEGMRIDPELKKKNLQQKI